MTYQEMQKAEAALNAAIAPARKQRGATKAQLAYRAARFLHADHRRECMNFDSESGHSCAHCGAKYPADPHEPAEHTEDCPHAVLR